MARAVRDPTRRDGSVPQQPSPRSPQSASPWRLADCDLGEPLRQGDQLGSGLVCRRLSGRELLLAGLPCCGPFARQGGRTDLLDLIARSALRHRK
jgi:hypothetical protein